MALQVLRNFSVCTEHLLFSNRCRLLEQRTDPCLVVSSRPKFSSPKLTPQQVSSILRTNESHVDLKSVGSVRCFDTNQLPSNNPIEDRRAEAKCLHTTGMVFGVFDGHGGPACAEVVSRRLFAYLAAALLPTDVLRGLMDNSNSKQGENVFNLLEWYGDSSDTQSSDLSSCDPLAALPSTLADLYRSSFLDYVEETLKQNEGKQKEFQMRDALVRVFLHLDRDMWREAEMQQPLDLKQPLLSQTLAVAMSGAVTCVAHVDGPHLHVANTGDCGVVLGTLSESNTWVAKQLTRAHSVENADEVQRVTSEHPKNEIGTVLKQERLLGQLAPLRSFGDFRFKWSSSLQNRLLVPLFGHKVLPQNYYTPPYLTARPEVVHHRLLPRDKFMVLASDGLWEILPPSRVVQFVGEYMQGRQTLEPFRLPYENRQERSLTLGEISDALSQRREGLYHKPVDENAATHLVRSALGGTEYGIDHSVISEMLSAPEDIVRLVRDDITITVVFFDTDYLRRCPA